MLDYQTRKSNQCLICVYISLFPYEGYDSKSLDRLSKKREEEEEEEEENEQHQGYILCLGYLATID